ncbi:MAG: hypothetical protein AAF544_06610, partial [Bacteroidota bacterium]
AVSINPNSFKASWTLGMIYASVGQEEKACEEFQKAIDGGLSYVYSNGMTSEQMMGRVCN